jgi:hypothetical protein|tara:strand:- start:389 stop:577 length:189 start_codon:yes stop_codon:yes gene_type:complete
MTGEQYKQARKKSGLSQADWIFTLEISLDAHKSYCCGRRRIPPKIVRNVKELLAEIKKMENS